MKGAIFLSIVVVVTLTACGPDSKHAQADESLNVLAADPGREFKDYQASSTTNTDACCQDPEAPKKPKI